MHSTTCPLLLARAPEVRVWLDCWDAWKVLHTLPRAGGLDDQPAPLVEALRRCEGALGEYQVWRHREPEIDAAHMRGLTQMLGGTVVKGRPD